MRCFDKLSMTFCFYINVSGNGLADLLMAEKQKIRNSFDIASDFSFIDFEKSLSNDNHEASQKADFLLDRFDML